MTPEKCLLIDIDGLRPDVFQDALRAGQIPNLARLLGEPNSGVFQIPIAAPAPSITFCSQASLFTGAHPDTHGIPGNQFFDRFGHASAGVPRHYAFDVGDTLAVDDAVLVFTDHLAANRLQVPTIYERLSEMGKTSVVAGNMYAKGADTWIKPSLANIARFTKGGNLFGMSSREYDQDILDRLLQHLRTTGAPDFTTMYFMGLDHDSHLYGPENGQLPYLVEHVDPMVGQLIQVFEASLDGLPLCIVFSDHGQIEVIPDDEHSLRIGFPFDKEMGHLFKSLGLDVHDFPGEDPNCDAVMALNGGMAYVYLQNRTGRWADPPVFQRDVLPVGRAFWEAHLNGAHAQELQGALAGVLVRDVETYGWEAGYYALRPNGELAALDEWFAEQPAGFYTDPVNRLDNHAGRFSGDLLLLSNYSDGYYFGGETVGVHGGLHPEDSLATLCFGWADVPDETWIIIRARIADAIENRCQQEGGRFASTTDMITGYEAAFRFKG